MAHVLLFHSIRGLRPAEAAMAARLRAAGHEVTLPDLFDGRTVEDVEAGFALQQAIGWETIVARARAAAAGLPAGPVLAGASMGASLVGGALADRPDSAGLVLLHGMAELPPAVRPGLPVQVHMALPDPFEDEDFVAEWAAAAAERVALEMHRYPGPGHYFLDESLPDHDSAAAALAWERVLGFLGRLAD